VKMRIEDEVKLFTDEKLKELYTEDKKIILTLKTMLLLKKFEIKHFREELKERKINIKEFK